MPVPPLSSSEPVRFQPLRTPRIYEAVVDQLRDAIFSGDFRSGDRLPSEVELARQFQVSRSAIREAMRVLELSGLLTIRPGAGGGLFIADAAHRPLGSVFETMFHLEKFGLAEFYQARIAIESSTAELAAEAATEEDLAQLADIVRAESPAATSTAGMRSFHQGLAAATHNALLETIMMALVGLSDQLQFARSADPRVFSVSRKDHAQILEALVRRDSLLARARMADHLRRIQPLIPPPPAEDDGAENAAPGRQGEGA